MIKVLGITREQAHAIRFAMEYKTDAMRAINEQLRTYGVEYIPQGRNQKSPEIEYCNTGDTYKPTVMLINGKFVLGCWGDIVERGNHD